MKWRSNPIGKRTINRFLTTVILHASFFADHCYVQISYVNTTLSNATLLSDPHSEAPIAITSQSGAICEGTLATASLLQLRDPERNYSTFDR